MQWRYLACPGRHYLVLVAKNGGFLVGFIVIRHGKILKPDEYFGHIVDFLCLPGRVDAGALLIREALHFLKGKGRSAATWYAFENNHWYRLFLNEGFFQQRKGSLPFIVKTHGVNASPAFPLCLNEWHMVAGDIDVF